MNYKFEATTPPNQIIEYHLSGLFDGKVHKLSKKLMKDNIPHFISFKNDLTKREWALFAEKIDKNNWGIKIFTDDNDEGKHRHYDVVYDG